MDEKRLNHTGVLNVIRRAQPQLNPALQRIATYVLKHPERVKSLSIGELAEACQVSESTITRFVQTIEVPSYQELKIRLAEALTSYRRSPAPEGDTFIYEDIGADDTTEQIVKKILYRSKSTIDDTAAQLDLEAIDRAASVIDRCDVLAFFAMGTSTLAVENAVMRFMRVGKRCVFFRDQGLQQISASTLGKASVAIAISDSGRSIQVIDSLTKAREGGATTIAVTSFPDSPLARAAEIVLLTTPSEAHVESASYRESMLSKHAQILVTDVLYSRFALKNAKQSIAKLKDTNVVIEESRKRDSRRSG